MKGHPGFPGEPGLPVSILVH